MHRAASRDYASIRSKFIDGNRCLEYWTGTFWIKFSTSSGAGNPYV